MVVEELVNWLMFNAIIVVNMDISKNCGQQTNAACQQDHYEQDSWDYGDNENYDGEMYYDGEQYYDQGGEYQTGSQGENLIQDSNQGYGSVDQTPVGENDNYQGYV